MDGIITGDLIETVFLYYVFFCVPYFVMLNPDCKKNAFAKGAATPFREVLTACDKGQISSPFRKINSSSEEGTSCPPGVKEKAPQWTRSGPLMEFDQWGRVSI